MENTLIAALAGGFVVGFIVAFVIANKKSKVSLDECQARVDKHQAKLSSMIGIDQYNSAQEQAQAQISQLQEQISSLNQQLSEQHNQFEQQKNDIQSSMQSQIDQANSAHDETRKFLNDELNIVLSDLNALTDLLVTFERWHESLTQLMEHTAEMHHQNQEFFNIVKQIVILALNAAIEAARAGEHGRV